MLKGKAAIVTGSTSGIGLGIARALAGEGCNVMLNGFGQPDELRALQDGMAREFKVDVGYDGADMSDPAACAQLVTHAERRWGTVDVLVNNAGIQHVAPVDEFPTERWDAVIAINLSSAFHTIRAALPGMKRKAWGRIVNIASAHGLVASIHKSAYVAAKHGLVGLTKVVALETAELPITCNAICPGWVLTPLVQRQIEARAAAQGISLEQAGRDLLGEKQPSKTFSTPEQIGAYAVFLCSEAAANITGAALTIDGGWTAQ